VPRLILGPVLRHVGATDATIWVETDGRCEVEVLGHSTRTFQVGGHHYAVLTVLRLDPGASTPYEVRLDGELVWPEADSPFPPSRIRTIDPDAPLRLVFGSCRVGFPYHPPYTAPREAHKLGRGHDALHGVVRRMLEDDESAWPDAVLMLGDQVYADEVSPDALAFIRSRRSTEGEPGEEVADFEEYTRLYWESWSNPPIRWFLSTVPSAMLWDDHDVHDDWNISSRWVDRMRQQPWWEDRIAGAFVSYWVYQHLGNLAPAELDADELLARVRGTDDALPLLRDYALGADRQNEGTRWSFSRDFGRTRLVAIDCRAGRVLKEGRREMMDEHEWSWLVERAHGECDHLLLGMSDPWLLAPAVHDLQAWNEAATGGAWGRLFVPVAEWLREKLDLDHWASFVDSFADLTELVLAVAEGERGPPPATIVGLSGDVHNAYLAELDAPRRGRVESRVYQAVCSPFRNPLTRRQRRAQQLACTSPLRALGRVLARSAGVPRPDVEWRYLSGPAFGNRVGTLEIEGRRALLRVESPVGGAEESPRLALSFEHRLA
jgi:PhoD-like phosphatase